MYVATTEVNEREGEVKDEVAATPEGEGEA